MPSQWNVSWHHVDLGIPAIWAQRILGQGVTVALLDTGLAAPVGLDRTDFEYLNARGEGVVASDSNGHGTSAGSVIACHAGGALGIAPHAKLVSMKVVDTGHSAADIETAFRYLEGRADIDVVSCSFVMPSVSDALRESIAHLISSGKVVIAAAGNDETKMAFPEQMQSVLTVSALDAKRRPLPGARRGLWIDVAAPGFDIPVVLPGTARCGRFGQSSAAAAVTSGVAALVLSARPAGPSRTALARRLEPLFKTTARPLAPAASPGGFGIINPQALLEAAQSPEPVNP